MISTEFAVQSRARSYMKVRTGPSGVHVFDRMTGLNILLDEVQVPPQYWAAAPRQVSIALTDFCDLSCPYCFSSKNDGALDVEQVCGWLDELDANGCFGIGFGGGEPTLYPHLEEVCRYAAEHTRLAVTLTTHAHHLDDALMAALEGTVHFVRVSMDGVGATYEALRGKPFAALYNRLKGMRKLAPFGINFVVNAQTFPDLDAAITLAAEVGATEFLLLPEQPTQESSGIDDYTVQALCHWASHYRGKVPITVSEAGAEGLPTCNPFELEPGLRSYAHIDAKGVMKKSSFNKGGMTIGAEGVMQALNELQNGEERL